MAQRWAQQKLDRNRQLRDRKMGRVMKRHYFPEVEPIGAPCALPTPLENKQAEREAIARFDGKVARFACTGQTDAVTRRGRNMRKARGEVVRPESGKCARFANKIASTGMKGIIGKPTAADWDKYAERRETEWPIYTR